MRARTTWIAAAAAVAMMLTACGGDDGGNGGTRTGAGGDVEFADLSGQTVEVAAVWSGDEQKRFTEVLNKFAEETGAEFRFTSTGDDIATVLGTRLQGGSPPDVAMLPQPGLLNDLAQRKALKPIEDVAGDVVDDNFADVWRELGTVDGQLYGVWFKAANKSTVWYRTKAFADAGVEEPKTWEQFITAAQTISDSGVTPISIGGGDGWTLTDWFENVYLRTAGPEKYDQLARHEIPWTDESVKTALRKLAEVWGKPNLIVGGAAGALGTSFEQSVTNVFADPPKGAIVYEGDFVAGVVTAQTKAKPGEDAKFFPFPSIDGSKPSVVGGGDVAVLLKDSVAGKELMKFLATPEAAEVYAPLGGYTSPNQNVDTDLYPDETSKRSAEELANAETFRFDLSDLQPAAFGGTVGQGMWKLLQDFLRNPSNVDGTAAQLEAAAARAYK